MAEIIPGITEKEYKDVEARLKQVAPYVSWVHLDIADNTYVPNVLYMDFEKLGKLFVQDFAKHISVEAHIMVADPSKYIKPLVDAGIKRIAAHVEANEPRRFLDEAKYESIEAGLAIDGPTEIELIEPYFDEIDFVHIMTIESGFSGTPFMPETVEKIRIIRENYPNLPISVDGGINETTVKVVSDAGVSRIIVTSFLYKHADDIPGLLQSLRNN